MVEGKVVDSNMDGLSGSLFAILVYYPEVEDLGLEVVVGNAVYVNCTGDMTTVFLYSIFQTAAGFFYVRKAATLCKKGCNLSYLEESSSCLENGIKEHRSPVTSAVYIHGISNKHQVNPALNFNTRKMHIPEIFNHLLGADRSSNESDQTADSEL